MSTYKGVCGVYRALLSESNGFRTRMHWKLVHIDPGSLFVVQIGKVIEFGVNGTDQTKEYIRGKNPTSWKLLGQIEFR